MNHIFNWRLVYLLTIGFRFVLAVANSYIHPDEHFQSFEVICGKILGYAVNVPWEFTESSARSWGPLYLFYGPLLYAIKYLQLDLRPIHIWYLVRLQNMIIGWIIIDLCLYKMLPTKPERIKAIFFTLTSYVTLVYQSHGFSNSIETVLVVLSVYIIDDLRYYCEKPDLIAKSSSSKLLALGVIVAIGIFNRVTFPVFLVIPSWFVAKYLWLKPSHFVPLVVSFALCCWGFVVFDSNIDSILEDPLEWSNYVITPLNNFIYNSKFENLSQHGIHSRWTHIAVNLPQILGPGLGLLVGLNKYFKTTPFLSALSGVLFLSLVPHQELRFLTPVVPLLCSCFDFAEEETAMLRNAREKETDKQDLIPETNWRQKMISVYVSTWYAFNICLSVLMGVYHQGGVVPVMDHFHDYVSNDSSTIQVWWRTYTPPTWILGDTKDSTEIITLNDEKFAFSLNPSKSHHIIDAMGMDYENLITVLQSIQSSKKSILNRWKSSDSVFLITPENSYDLFAESPFNFEKNWSYDQHIDLDHLDLTNIKLGLGVYQLI